MKDKQMVIKFAIYFYTNDKVGYQVKHWGPETVEKIELAPFKYCR